MATALDVFPFGSVEISEETKEHVLLLNEQARRARLEFEQEDKRVVVSVVSGLTRFENRVPPGEGDLKWVLEYIGVKKWSECNKEVKFLEVSERWRRFCVQTFLREIECREFAEC